jgi:hypothetical protein
MVFRMQYLGWWNHWVVKDQEMPAMFLNRRFTRLAFYT